MLLLGLKTKKYKQPSVTHQKVWHHEKAGEYAHQCMLVEKSRDGVVAVNDDNAVSGSCFSVGQGEIGGNNLILDSLSFGILTSLPLMATILNS